MGQSAQKCGQKMGQSADKCGQKQTHRFLGLVKITEPLLARTDKVGMRVPPYCYNVFLQANSFNYKSDKRCRPTHCTVAKHRPTDSHPHYNSTHARHSRQWPRLFSAIILRFPAVCLSIPHTKTKQKMWE